MQTIPLPRPRRAAGVALCVPALAIFALLAADLLLHGPFTHADPGFSLRLQAWRDPGLTWAMQALSILHGTAGALTFAALLAAWLAWRRQWHWLPLVAAAIPGGMVLNVTAKHLFERARPSFEGWPPVQLGTYSFPSGHALQATVCWGVLLTLYWGRERRPFARALATLVAIAVVALTALSRVYLGFHHASDVVAGTCEGVAWLCACFALASRSPAAAGVAP